LWAKVPAADGMAFASGLAAQYNATVLPGNVLVRDVRGSNPVRVASASPGLPSRTTAPKPLNESSPTSKHLLLADDLLAAKHHRSRVG
jgi:hypothetical protein